MLLSLTNTTIAERDTLVKSNTKKTYETSVTHRTHNQPSRQQIDKGKPSHKQIHGRRPVAMQTIVSTLLLFVCGVGVLLAGRLLLGRFPVGKLLNGRLLDGNFLRRTGGVPTGGGG